MQLSGNITTQDPSKMATAQYEIKPSYPCKMTFHMTQEDYKTFNDIYATRMLQQRRTEKSALLSEAIKLLLEKEKRDGHI